MNKLYHLLAICVIAVWGTTFVNTKVLLQHGLTPAEIFLLRFIIAYLCIWFISPKKLWADNLKDELWLMALGVSGGSLYFLTENTALQLSYVNNVAFLVCTAPLITTLLAIALYKDVKATRPLIIGSLLALIGVAIVIFNGHFVLKLNPLGDILALSAALCWAVYSIIIKKISARYSATFITRVESDYQKDWRLKILQLHLFESRYNSGGECCYPQRAHDNHGLHWQRPHSRWCIYRKSGQRDINDHQWISENYSAPQCIVTQNNCCLYDELSVKAS